MNKAKKTFFASLIFILMHSFVFSQEEALELSIDISSKAKPKPALVQANIDLCGRGFNSDIAWPQNLSSKEVLETWKKDIGFSNTFRLQYNLWEINQLAKDKKQQDKLLANYEEAIRSISDSGGLVILDIYSAPAGVGKVLDRRSAAVNISAFKSLVKDSMQRLSCEKKYNVWYELWSGTDLSDFFIGSRQDYFNMYKAVAEGAKELEAQFKVKIPVGAPATSNWFHNLEDNTILSPEKSLIYEFIKFCASSGLPVDFITWHSYTSDPKAEGELTVYNKTFITLIREWLSYFNFKKDTPLIVTEWNFDQNSNILPARKKRSHIAASFVPARIKAMADSGLDNQVYFSLEDFQNNPENVNRDTGVFYFDADSAHYKGGPKAIYNVFRMINMLGPELFAVKVDDEFVGAFAAKIPEGAAILIYNYIDPDVSRNYISRNIASLNPADRNFLVNIIRTGEFNKIISDKKPASSYRLRPRVLTMVNKAQELYGKALTYKEHPRVLKISLKGLKEEYSYARYLVDHSCSLGCEFRPAEEKSVSAQEIYQEDLQLEPYSVNLIIFKKKNFADGR